MSTKFVTIHNNWDPNLVFPFVVERFGQGSIYIEPMWGIKVDKVTADGGAVPGLEFKAKLDDLNLNKVKIGADPFIYLVRRSNLVFARKFSDESYQLERYTIPPDAKRIVVEYRLRESPDTVGPALVLESTLS